MAASTYPVLSIEGLSKSFTGIKALDDVDLRISAGEVHALVGQNGSGKSTLIKVLAGVHAPDAPTVGVVNGKDMALGDGRSAHEVGLRFVHQDLGLVPTLNSIDNLALGFGYPTGFGSSIKWREQRERARRALAVVVDDFPIDRPIGSLTIFQRTAVAIARALQDFETNGSLLVLDEPTAAMPRKQVEHLFDLLARIKERGAPVLLVTHHLEEVFASADTVTVLRDGQRVVTAPAAEMDAPGLVQLMTGGKQASIDRSRKTVDDAVVLSLRTIAGGAVRDLSLDVRRGEVVGIAGLSGSGRDDLAELIFGGAKRTGTVDVEGITLKQARPDSSVQMGIGYVPANRHRDGLVLDQSVRDNLTLPTLAEFVSFGRIRAKKERAAAQDWVGRLGVKTQSTESSVVTLSGGNQQKVVIGKWLRLQPKVLLLDEPTQGVDVAAQAELHRLLADAANDGTAILVCSSDELELSRLCDRVIVLRDGKAAVELGPDALSAESIFGHILQQAPGAVTTPAPAESGTTINDVPEHRGLAMTNQELTR